MRRRIRKKYLFLNIFFLFLFLLTIIGVSYSYLSSSLSIKGTIKGKIVNTGYVIDPASNPNLTAIIATTNQTVEGGLNRFDFILNIKNTGSTTLDNFIVTITFRTAIQSPSVQDYDYNLAAKTLTITNTKYDLNPNQTSSVILTVYSNSTTMSINKLKLDALTSATEVAITRFPVNFVITNSSDSYIYQYNATVTNKTGKTIAFWKLSIELPAGTTFVSGSNAIFSTQGSTLIIKSTGTNGNIGNNKSATFQLQLSTDTANFIPSNIRAFVR